MAYVYSISAGNPEGTDFTMLIEHDEKFTGEQFQNIAEEAFADALDKQAEVESKNKSYYVSLCSIRCGYIMNALRIKGFREFQMTNGYYLEPFWGRDRIKSDRLIKWLDRTVCDDKRIEEMDNNKKGNE